LQVHFPNRGSSDEAPDVVDLEKKIEKELDALVKTVKDQNEVLDNCLVQLDQYQQVTTLF